MQTSLSHEEWKYLKLALDQAVVHLERELVRTDAPTLQHALNADYEATRKLRDRLTREFERVKPAASVRG